MAEANKLDVSDIFNDSFPSTEERLDEAFKDPAVWKRSGVIMQASLTERPGLQAEVNTYLAAAHILFPHESQIIHDSLEAKDEG
jgi:hypothetical protein